MEKANDEPECAPELNGLVESALPVEGGMQPPPVIDRFWFKSVYFRGPGGVLFKSATDGPGFGADEDLATLCESPVLSSLPNISKAILCPLLPADHPA